VELLDPKPGIGRG